ncbi:MAG TPA: hypothetical protein VFJ78_00585 [Gaiellaceae bacterium]|nr:hypothetical protein [Gaiellaceae bacterium]
MRKLLVPIVAALALASNAPAAVKPVPSLQPKATHALWLKLVARAKARPRAVADASCRAARVVFYAPTDWLRLATKLAQYQSPCAQYYISVPPLAADKTQARSGQAAQIRALGPNFHAVDEISWTAFANWVASGAGSFADAGALARQRMAAAGFDASAGDTWALNELSSAVRAGTGSARANAVTFLNALAGDGVKGIAFGAGVSQTTADLSTYKVSLQNWLQDAGFWSSVANDVSDFAYENYGDIRAYAVDGSSPQQRRDATMQYLGHLQTLARAAPPSAAAAAAFLQQTYTTFGNAAWSWDSAYGYTATTLLGMQDYVSGQAYASRSFAAATAAPVDRFGYAWAPSNVSATDSGSLLDVLATAIRDSAAPTDDVGILACASNRCGQPFAGAAFTTAWQQFSAWSASAVGFASAAPTLTAGGVAGPLSVQVQTAGVVDTAKADTPVVLSTSSAKGGFSTAPTGPFTPTLSVTIPAGSSSAAVYYTDTQAGTASISAAVAGQPAIVQQATVAADALASLNVVPAKTSVKAGATLQFSAAGADRFGNAVPTSIAWTTTIGRISPNGLLTAPKTGGAGLVTARAGSVLASAALTVLNPLPKVQSVRVKRVAGHVVATVLVAPKARVPITLRVRRGSSTVALVRVTTTRTGTYSWRSKKVLPAGRYVAKAAVRSASTA